jgi:hypothetical protein
MAALTGADFTRYKKQLRADPVALAEMKTAGLSKAQWMAALQAIEDRWTNDQPNYKAAVDTAAGKTLSNTMAKKLAKVWMENKWGGE